MLTVTELIEVKPEWRKTVITWIEPNTVPARGDSWDAFYETEADVRLMAMNHYPQPDAEESFLDFLAINWAYAVTVKDWKVEDDEAPLSNSEGPIEWFNGVDCDGTPY